MAPPPAKPKAKAKVVPKAVAKRGAGANSSGRMSLISFFCGFVLACVGLMPTMMVLVFGLAPALVAVLVDRSEQRSLSVCVIALNFAATVPFIVALWHQGHTIANALLILSSSITWATMFGGAALGWVVFLFVPNIVATLVAMRARMKITELQKTQEDLRKEWGPMVASDKPIDELEPTGHVQV